MATLTQAERLMKLETNVDNLDKKVEVGFADLKGGLKELTSTVQQLVPTLVTQTQLNEKVIELESQIAQLNRDIASTRSRSWIWNTLSAIFGAILLFLIQYALTH